MLSSTDFQKVWFLYQTEGAPKGISINSFCVNQGVPYNEFEKWYKKNHQKVAEVNVVGSPEQTSEDTLPAEAPRAVQTKDSENKKRRGNILVTIKTSDGLHISKGGMDYEELKLLVSRLEGFC
jgi:hypothetical protein